MLTFLKIVSFCALKNITAGFQWLDQSFCTLKRLWFYTLKCRHLFYLLLDICIIFNFLLTTFGVTEFRILSQKHFSVSVLTPFFLDCAGSMDLHCYPNYLLHYHQFFHFIKTSLFSITHSYILFHWLPLAPTIQFSVFLQWPYLLLSSLQLFWNLNRRRSVVNEEGLYM